MLIGIIRSSTAMIIAIGMWQSKNIDPGGQLPPGEHLEVAVRDGLFQVVAMLTTTGFGTADFDQWHNFSRALLIVLMFVGGCAGSTGGGMKVIRHILFVKTLRRGVEHSYHPSVVRNIRLGGEAIVDPDLPINILLYFGLIALIFTVSSQVLVGIEPDSTWTLSGQPVNNKLIDSASAVAATIHNIGPGIGLVGSSGSLVR